MWPNRERRHGWTIANRRGCLVDHLDSSFRRWWYNLIPNSFRKHHWSRASILSTSLLVTAQHSELYRKISRMQLLYNFSVVGMVILAFQVWLSRFCTAARVMALRREISRELWVVEWTRELWQSYVCARNINWRFGHKTSSSPPMLVFLQPLRHSQWMAHHVTFMRSTRIEVPGTVCLNEEILDSTWAWLLAFILPLIALFVILLCNVLCKVTWIYCNFTCVLSDVIIKTWCPKNQKYCKQMRLGLPSYNAANRLRPGP